WIPYSVLFVGMTLLAVQVAVQVAQQSLLGLVAAAACALALMFMTRPAGPLIVGASQAGVGIAYCIATLVVMLSGMPIAFALG
ncbi:hypothetical protein NL529_32265, partial [Klebsiella pneumoniae]|nr:hypothetical protein [Klebsiella pneumoniae]